MKIALGFWGITRSLSFTLDSIQRNIFDILKKNNIDYTIFIHTYSVNYVYNNSRANEINIELDNQEYNLLGADYIEIDKQEDVKKNIDFLQFRTFPDPWNTNYQTVDNFILALHSKQKLTRMIQQSGTSFDFVIFLRPDVLYLTPLNMNFFNLVDESSILIPDFHLYYFKFNDRFAITHFKNYKIYGTLYEKLLEYSRIKKLHSEQFHYYYLSKLLTIKYIPFYFQRIRANGKIAEQDEFLSKI